MTNYFQARHHFNHTAGGLVSNKASSTLNGVGGSRVQWQVICDRGRVCSISPEGYDPAEEFFSH